MTDHTVGYDAVVLAGGAARRLGGVDKPALRVGGRTLLDRVLSACAGAGTSVVVGPRRATARPVRWVQEQPPGSGPLAALAAGLRRTNASMVLVLSADLPFVSTATVRALLRAALGGTEEAAADTAATELAPGRNTVAMVEGAVVTDGEGRDNPLVAVYRAESLRRELALLVSEHGTLSGLPFRLLTSELSLTRLVRPTDAVDCDTWDALTAARARIREHGQVLNQWIDAVKDELGIDLDVDSAALLDLARDAAHGVARPAAPLTTFLVGYAAAQRGGGSEAVGEVARKAAALAARWEAETGPGTATEQPPR